MLAAEDVMFAAVETRFGPGFTPKERALVDFRTAHGSPLRLRAEARTRWSEGDFVAAAGQFRQAAIGLPVDGSLKLKAAVAGVAAPVLATASRVLGRGRHA
jgi:hypothetical protein